MTPEEVKCRTKAFASRVIRVFKALPRNEEARTLGKQMLRSGTSVAANYRAVCRSRSKAEFLARLGIVVEEIDETVLWLELVCDSEIFSRGTPKGITRRSERTFGDFGHIPAHG